MLMDERRSANGERFVFSGVIARTAALPMIRDELRAAASRFAGNAAAELKYVPDTGSAQATWCAQHGLASRDAKQAVFASLTSRPKPEATVIVCCIVDPRRHRSAITDAEVYAWGFDMVMQRFARFLFGQQDRAEGGPNEVIVDTLSAEPRRFHDIYATAYDEGWSWLPSPVAPLKRARTRDILLSSMAAFAPPLWLPDHVGGAVDDWIKVELQSDAAAAEARPGPPTGLVVGARRRVAQLLPNFRNTSPGYSVAAWPKESLSNERLAEWLRRLREQARTDTATASP